mgnify:CR=1 FL=1
MITDELILNPLKLQDGEEEEIEEKAGSDDLNLDDNDKLNEPEEEIKEDDEIE